MNETLAQLKSRMENLAGQWNGDEPGEGETRAEIAEEVLGMLNRIEELISTL